jgi:uncharacterized membrane protein HdeD (DUF308 family)
MNIWLIAAGAVTGIVLGIANGFFSYLTAKRSLTQKKGKALIIMTLSFFARFSAIFTLIYFFSKFTEKDFMYSLLGGLVLITLFSPYKFFFKRDKLK